MPAAHRTAKMVNEIRALVMFTDEAISVTKKEARAAMESATFLLTIFHRFIYQILRPAVAGSVQVLRQGSSTSHQYDVLTRYFSDGHKIHYISNLSQN